MSNTGTWNYDHNQYGVNGGTPPYRPAYSEHPQGQPPYWLGQGQHSFSHPSAPPPPPSYPYTYPAHPSGPAYPPSAPSFAPPHPHPPSGPAYPPSAPSFAPPHPHPPYSSASFVSYPPGYPAADINRPANSQTPPPYPPVSSSNYPSLAGLNGYPSGQPSGPPHVGEATYSSSSLSSSSYLHNRPGDSPRLQAHGSFSSTGSSGGSLHGIQHSQTFSEGGSYSHASSQGYWGEAGASGALVPCKAQGDVSLKYLLLYGTLDVRIHSATNLPNLDTFSDTLRQCLTVVEPAFPNLQATISKRITSDPYVCVVLKGANLARTAVISNNQDPIWEEHFSIHVAHKVAVIELIVKDNDMLGSQYIGEVKISAESLLGNPIREQPFDLLNKNGKPCKPGAKLKISMEYCPINRDPLYRYGVGGPPYNGVSSTYFPLRTGGRLTLYQDAHVSGTILPVIKLASGMNFQHRSCWEDICQAIVDAQHLIYITGWSIYTKITLIRDNDKARDAVYYKNLGELLKFKAEKGGVRVLLLVWDDKTSHSFFNNVGVMGTHDEETRKFFRGSGVKCLLAPRYPDSKLSVVKQQVVGTLYTHHQKTVIVDSKGPMNKRMLTAFVGGLDLCDGRYDTPEHTLFANLNTVYKDDYHNPTFLTKVDSGGPREPWHDMHCKIEGPAAYDVLTNFEQRWRKVAKGIRTKIGIKHDFLLDFQQKAGAIVDVRDKAALYVTNDKDPESWHIQVFRSIDSGSVKGFPKDAKKAAEENLVPRKNIAIDMSIHTAYIKAIRSAQHFIYIENQYFLGSSFAWPSYKVAGADHLIPIEIALKIVSKIKAREDFAVYVVVPMWPEGDPTSLATQEILYFQSQTMEMMYTLIADAIKEEDLEGACHPTDFLNFFCLGNRELKRANEPLPSVAPVEGSTQAKAFKSRRFMIYVHSKGMIVDDEYVIIGSANINQRSMDGSRDTEIAMGAYQPFHTWARIHVPPRGEVYGYRMSLWAEHLRASEQCFSEPWGPTCVKRVQFLTQRNWTQYTADDVRETEGHLLPYPLKVESNGKVLSLPDFEVFPDVGGRILGVPTNLPDNLTS